MLIISRWEDVFEIAQSRKYKNLTWFSMPNDYSSGGILETLSKSEGLEFVGIWFLLLQMASKMPKRGVFVSDSGKVITLKRIALTLRIDENKLKNAVNHFYDIGWIEITPEKEEYQDARSELVANYQLEKETEEETEEEKEKEKENSRLKSLEIDFLKFWDLYGKKNDKEKTFKKWSRLKEKEKSLIFEKLPDYLESTPDLKFRKNPLTWLNGRCWEDEIILEPRSLEKPKAQRGQENALNILNSIAKEEGFANGKNIPIFKNKN